MLIKNVIDGESLVTVLQDANDPLFGLIKATNSPLAKLHKGLCGVGVLLQGAD